MGKKNKGQGGGKEPQDKGATQKPEPPSQPQGQQGGAQSQESQGKGGKKKGPPQQQHDQSEPKPGPSKQDQQQGKFQEKGGDKRAGGDFGPSGFKERGGQGFPELPGKPMKGGPGGDRRDDGDRGPKQQGQTTQHQQQRQPGDQQPRQQGQQQVWQKSQQQPRPQGRQQPLPQDQQQQLGQGQQQQWGQGPHRQQGPAQQYQRQPSDQHPRQQQGQQQPRPHGQQQQWKEGEQQQGQQQVWQKSQQQPRPQGRQQPLPQDQQQQLGQGQQQQWGQGPHRQQGQAQQYQQQASDQHPRQQQGQQQPRPHGQQQQWKQGEQQQGQQQVWQKSQQQPRPQGRQQPLPQDQQQQLGQGQQQQWGQGPHRQQGPAQQYQRQPSDQHPRQQQDQQQPRPYGQQQPTQQQQLKQGQQQRQGPSGQQQQQRQQGAWGQPQQERGRGQTAHSGETTPVSISRSESVQSVSSAISKLSLEKSKPAVFSYVPSGIPVQKGTKGRRIKLEVNYFDLNVNNMVDEAWQYDVKFDPERPKKFLRLAFNAFTHKILNSRQILMAFDGKAIAYCHTRLNGDILDIAHEVKIIEPDTTKEKIFKVTIKEALDPKIELNSLRNYSKDRIFDKPMRAVQCLDVILRSPPSDSPLSVRAGRSFFVKKITPNQQRIDLQDGYELWFGLFQAAVLGDKPYLNIDVSHKAFPSEMQVMDCVKSVCRDLRGEIDYRGKEKINSFLKSVDIIYRAPDGVERRYKCNGLADPANRAFFEFGERRMTVEQYFTNEKRTRLQFPHLPCISAGTKGTLLPLEFCRIPGGQATNKKAGENQVREMIRTAATSTGERKQRILNLFNLFDYERNPIIRKFNISIGKDFINIDARIIDPPLLEYANQRTIKPFKGQWRPENEQFIVPKPMLQWAILITDRSVTDYNAKDFSSLMVKMGRNLNMNISDRPDIRKISDHDREIEQELVKFKEAKKDLVVVVISGFRDSYSKIKQPAENRFGVLTQCIKAVTIQRRCNPSTIQNILLKVNAKLGGFNHKIADQSQPSFTFQDVMFMGADVTHPSPDQRSIPSVIGVAATHDRHGFKYNMRYRLQDPKKEIIDEMEEILRDQLHYYKQLNGTLPKKIIYYRDGVSDGQFEQVRRTEFTAMNNACAKIQPNYKPAITCIVVQKRHHTRFFPPAGSDIGKLDRKYNNVPPGTIVDNKITHPAENQFFLVSHESIQGIAKPTKYCLLRDDSKFNIDELQAMTYSLCHMFTRCNRAVSYPAPAYYAHLAAYRGRVYIERAQGFNMNNLRLEYNRRQIKDEILFERPMFFV